MCTITNSFRLLMGRRRVSDPLNSTEMQRLLQSYAKWDYHIAAANVLLQSCSENSIIGMILFRLPFQEKLR